MDMLVTMQGISKSYGNSRALENVSLELKRGSVHALMGENGAGKSSLMKILAGVVHPDAGTITKNGVPLVVRNPRQALESGISTVFQELSVLPNLTIAENIFLGKEPITKIRAIDRGRMEADAAAILRSLDLALDPRTLISELSIADRQFVEIARGISANADIVILDEPTAALNAADVEKLNRHIERLKSQGKAIVYISHRMEEVFQVCDTVTVLKDGRNVDTLPMADVTPKSLVAMMVGRQIEDLYPARAAAAGDTVLAIDGLRLTQDSKPISLTLRRGEILGLAGLEGQGQREILRSVIGEFAPFEGRIGVKGILFNLPLSRAAGVRRMQALGVGYVPEDRKDEGLLLSLPIKRNITIGLHAGLNMLSFAPGYQKIVEATMGKLNVKAATSSALVSSLSGGNQQKVLLGRYMAKEADILLIEEPTRGVDIGAKVEIYKLLREFANGGGAAIVLSRETIELIGLCDRIIVIHAGTAATEMAAEDATEHKILDAALVA